MTRRNLSLLLSGIFCCLLCYSRDELDPFARYVADGYEKIDQFAYDDVPEDMLFEGAMRGMVDVLSERGDPHSGFVPAEVKTSFDEEFKQEFGGIGVRLKVAGEPPRLVVAAPLVAGGPAAQAGIQPGDVLLAVGDQPVGPPTPQEFQKVLRLIRGRPQSRVKLSLERAGQSEPIVMDVVRQLVSTESVIGDRLRADGTWIYPLGQDPRVALVRIASFGDKTADELQRVLLALRDQGIAAVILDLRDNPGGTLDAGVAVCDLFLRAGSTIVETRERQRRDKVFSSGNGSFVDLPLAVLVNGESASASELVAGCLKDNGRAVVAGARSYGKGTVQQLVPVQSGRSYLKLTAATFWPPSGRRIHRPIGDDPQGDWGITPTDGLAVELADEQIAAWREGRHERDAQVVGETAGASSGDSAPWQDQVVDLTVEYLNDHHELGDVPAKSR